MESMNTEKEERSRSGRAQNREDDQKQTEPEQLSDRSTPIRNAEEHTLAEEVDSDLRSAEFNITEEENDGHYNFCNAGMKKDT